MSCRFSLATLFPIVLKAAIEVRAAQRQHSRLLRREPITVLHPFESVSDVIYTRLDPSVNPEQKVLKMTYCADFGSEATFL
jgi:hypothetical protein